MMRRRRFGTAGLAVGALLLAGFSLWLWLAEPSVVEAQTSTQRKVEKKGSSQTAQAQSRTLRLRDPFRSLLRTGEEASERALPPGKRGLVIQRLTLNGIVATEEGRLAVVSMRGRNRAYFLRERDELFDGYVFRITQDEVVFKERATDAFGQSYEQEVTKQISGSGAK